MGSRVRDSALEIHFIHQWPGQKKYPEVVQSLSYLTRAALHYTALLRSSVASPRRRVLFPTLVGGFRVILHDLEDSPRRRQPFPLCPHLFIFD